MARTISIRLTLEQADQVRQQMERVGAAGETVLKRIEEAARRADAANKQWDGHAKVLSGVRNEIDQLAGRIPVVGTALSALTGPLGLAAAGVAALGVAIAAGIGKAQGWADKLASAADSVGLTIRAYHELEGAFALAGAGADTFNAGIVKLQERIAEAVRGNDEAVAAFRRVGVGFQTVGGQARGADQVLLDLADRLKGITDPAERVAAAIDVLGKAGSKMLPGLQDGAVGLDRLTGAARSAGGALDEELIRKGAEANAKMEALAQAIETRLNVAILKTKALLVDVFSPSGLGAINARIAELEASGPGVTAMPGLVGGRINPRIAAAQRSSADRTELAALYSDQAMILTAAAYPQRYTAVPGSKGGTQDPNAQTQKEAIDALNKALDEEIKRLAEIEKLNEHIFEQRVKMALDAYKLEQDGFDWLKKQEEQRGKINRSIEESIQKLELEASYSGELTTERKVQLALFEQQNKLIDDQGNRIRDLTDIERDRIRGAIELRDRIDEQTKAAERLQREQDRVGGVIADRLVQFGQEGFFDLLDGKSQNFWQSFETYGKRAIAQIAAEALLRGPATALGQSLSASLFGGTVLSTAAGGGGSSLGLLSNVAGAGRSLFSLFGGGGASLAGIGAAEEAAALTGSGFLGSASAGAGLFSSLAGPLAIGGLAATLILPKLFGGKKSVGPIGHTNLDIAGGVFGVGTSGADNGFDPSGTREAVAQAAQALNALRTTYGLSVAGPYANFANTGGQFGIAGGAASGPKSAAELVFQVLRGNQYSGAGILSGSGNVGLALANSKGTTAEAIEADLALAKAFDDFVTSAKAANDNVSPLKAELDALAKQFDDMRQSVQGLGIATADLDAIEQQRIAKLKGDFAQGIEDSILALTDPLELARRQEQRRYDQQVEDAKALNADLARIDELHRLNLLDIQARANAAETAAAQQAMQQLSAARANLLTGIDSILLGNLSPLGFADRQTYAQGRYQSTLAAAQGGNASALAALPGLAQNYLGVVDQNWATGGMALDIRRQVASDLLGLAGVNPGSVSGDLKATALTITDGLQAQTDTLADLLNRILAELQRTGRAANFNDLAGLDMAA